MTKRFTIFIFLLCILGWQTLQAQSIRTANIVNPDSNRELCLNGIDQYIEIFASVDIYKLQKGTIAFWFKMNDLNGYQSLFTMTDNRADWFRSDFAIIIFREAQGKKIEYSVANNNEPISVSLTDPNLLDYTDWHHFALVADGVGSIEAYLDGAMVAMRQGFCCGPVDYFLAHAQDANNMKIGAFDRLGPASFGNFCMDDFMLFNVPLTAAQVQELYEGTLTGLNNNRMIYYTFDYLEDLSVGRAGTNDFRDHSGNGNHGDAINVTGLTVAPSRGDPEMAYFSLYPNPARANSTLSVYANALESVGQAQVSIYNLQGEVVHTETIYLTQTLVEIRIPNLSPGSYLLRIQGDNGLTGSQKLMIY
jgi:hypothetical protein